MSDFRDLMQSTAIPLALASLGDAVTHYPGGDVRDTAEPVEITAIVDLSETGEQTENTSKREAIPQRGTVTVADDVLLTWEDRFSRKSRLRIPVGGGFEMWSVVRRVECSGGTTTYLIERATPIGTRESSR